MEDFADIAEITAQTELPAAQYGVRAEALGKLLGAGMPVNPFIHTHAAFEDSHSEGTQLSIR